MDAVLNENKNIVDIENVRLDITNQLKQAIEANKSNSQTREWNTKKYKGKYGI